MPGKESRNVYLLSMPEGVEPGEYTLKLKLYSPTAKEDVKLALDPKRLDDKGYYTIGEVSLVK